VLIVDADGSPQGLKSAGPRIHSDQGIHGTIPKNSPQARRPSPRSADASAADCPQTRDPVHDNPRHHRSVKAKEALVALFRRRFTASREAREAGDILQGKSRETAHGTLYYPLRFKPTSAGLSEKCVFRRLTVGPCQ